MGKMLLGPLRARMIEWTCWTVSLNIAHDGITLSREAWGKEATKSRGAMEGGGSDNRKRSTCMIPGVRIRVWTKRLEEPE